VNALAKEEVGNYLNRQFVSAFQKVGTFRLVGGAKQGGNVATYFCKPDGSVLHVVAGPADAGTLLGEARWVVETYNLGVLECGNNLSRWKAFFRKAHLDRLRGEHQLDSKTLRLPPYTATPTTGIGTLLERLGPWRGLNQQGQVHYLLGSFPLVRIEKVYALVFEKILGEKVSTLPVAKDN
jgi:hypothetical protein